MPMKTGDGDSSGIPSNVPAFFGELWKLVEDPQYEEHISWNKNGSGFLVHDQATFAREIIPKYFKHNNFASFVRQLNMYGFRKVIGAEQGGLRSEKDEWEFFNGNFNKYHPELLENVKRKATPEKRNED
ncbi:LOW QUALITY PROTEIN: heat shock factor protein 4-like [Pocillopora verrucosa]|uniref:LOW QUALITY PROTEIN: heat shock factor protein 4-like n=1 Tax=Pocillopora verrucosa TaxID=203993 RepID=UPI0033415442